MVGNESPNTHTITSCLPHTQRQCDVDTLQTSNHPSNTGLMQRWEVYKRNGWMAPYTCLASPTVTTHLASTTESLNTRERERVSHLRPRISQFSLLILHQSAFRAFCGCLAYRVPQKCVSGSVWTLVAWQERVWGGGWQVLWSSG